MPTYLNFNESPAPFAFNPELLMSAGDGSVWWDFGDETTMFTDISMTTQITTSGQKVSVVLDKSPNGNHLVQTVTSRMPTFIIEGDQKFLRFDGPSLQHLVTGPAVQIAFRNCYGYTGFRTASGDAYQRILSAGKAGVANDVTGTGTFCLHTSTNTAWFGLRSNGTVLDPSFTGAGNSPLDIYEYSVQGANTAKVWKNGVLGNPDNSHVAPDVKTLGRIGVGALIANNEPTASSPFNGDLFGIMHFGAVLTPGEVGAVRAWWNVNRL